MRGLAGSVVDVGCPQRSKLCTKLFLSQRKSPEAPGVIAKLHVLILRNANML
jgi:hypothetical protein